MISTKASPVNAPTPGCVIKHRPRMRNEWLLRNPIRLVRQSAERQSVPDVLTIEEIGAILREQGSGPYYVMTFLAAVTGLRVSELLALKWEDVRFAAGEIHLSRAIVCQHVGPLKTEASQKPLPMGRGTGSGAVVVAVGCTVQSRHGLCLRIR